MLARVKVLLVLVDYTASSTSGIYLRMAKRGLSTNREMMDHNLVHNFLYHRFILVLHIIYYPVVKTTMVVRSVPLS